MEKIVVCGVGAIGSHLLFLMRNDPNEIDVIDFDKVESKNLNSQFYTKQVVGKNKAEAITLLMLNFFNKKLGLYRFKLVRENIETVLKNKTLVIDCFDNQESRLLVRDYCKSNSIPSLHAGISDDGEYGQVNWGEFFTPDKEEAGVATCEEGVDLLPMFTKIASCIAQEAKNYFETKEKRMYMISKFNVTARKVN